MNRWVSSDPTYYHISKIINCPQKDRFDFHYSCIVKVNYWKYNLGKGNSIYKVTYWHFVTKVLRFGNLWQKYLCTVFKNHRKSLIQHGEQSELHLHFEWTKVHKKCQKMVHFGEFLKSWSLRSNSVTRHVSFNRTKIGEKCQNSNATFWVIFKQCAFGTYLFW